MKKLKTSLPMIALVLGVIAASAFKPASHEKKIPELYYWWSVGPGGTTTSSPDEPPYGPENPFGCNGDGPTCCIGSTEATQIGGLWYPAGEFTKTFYRNQ